MERGIGKLQPGPSADKESAAFDSYHVEVKSNSDVLEQDSIAAPSDSPALSKPPRNARQARLLAALATLNSNITSTESHLSAKIQEITQLQSFRQQEGLKNDPDKAALAHAQTITNKQISLLKRYNEIKDIALGILSLIAEKEGKRLAEVMEERDVNEKD